MLSKEEITEARRLSQRFNRRSFLVRFFYSHLRSLLPTQLSISVKLAIYIGILLTVAMGSLGAVIIHDQTSLLNRQIHSTGRTVVSQMAESAKEPLLANDVLQLEVLAYNLATSENVLGTVIYSSELKVMAHSGQNPFDPYAPFEGRIKEYLHDNPQSLEWRWLYSPKGELDAISFMSPVRFKDVTAGYVLISFSRDSLTQAIDDAIRSIIAATALLIVLGIVVSYILGYRLTRPIQPLLDASRAIHNGQYDYQIQNQRSDEIGYLMNSLNSMAKGMLEKKQVEEAFTRHVSPNVAKEILNHLDEVKLGGTHVTASVLFVDIVGFTSRSETMTPQAIAELLNDFYTYITDTAPLFKGTIDKYIGDCAMVVFGIPESDEDHVYHAIAYAVFLQRLVEAINYRRMSRGEFPVHFRIGVNSGEMLAGNMGSRRRMQYTVVGDSVNLASRLSTAASADQILITEETYQLPGISKRINASKHLSMRVRGKSKPISTYIVHDVDPVEQARMEKAINKLLINMHKEKA